MRDVLECEADPAGPWRTELTAAHESGHALASVMAWGRTGKIVLHPNGRDGDTYKEAVLTRRDDDPEHSYLDVAVALAGPLAEAAWWARRIAPRTGHRPIPETLSLGSQGDYRVAVETLVTMECDPVAALRRVEADLGRWLLAPRQWAAVEAVVARLLARPLPVTLDGEQVARIVRQAAAL